MQTVSIGNIKFDSEITNHDPYIIGVFGAEGSGKTRFGLTGPEVIGCVPLEVKAYKTISETAAELGKRVFKPSDPNVLLVPNRKVDAMDDLSAQKFFKEHVKKINDVIYGMLEHPDVRTILIDKFTTYVQYVRYAVHGMTGKKVRKIGERTFIDLSESNQAIIDVMNSLSAYGKTIVLTNSEKAEYVDDKDTGRKIYEGFKYLGSHTNVLVHTEKNPFWKAGSEVKSKAWKFRLNVRQAQGATHLEGPEGNPLLNDDEINITNLVYNIEGDRFDAEVWA